MNYRVLEGYNWDFEKNLHLLEDIKTDLTKNENFTVYALTFLHEIAIEGAIQCANRRETPTAGCCRDGWRAFFPSESHPPPLICLPLLPHNHPLREVQECPTPWPTDNLPLKRPTKQAKKEEHHKRDPQYNSKRPPVILDLELNA